MGKTHLKILLDEKKLCTDNSKALECFAMAMVGTQRQLDEIQLDEIQHYEIWSSALASGRFKVA